jgi:glycosyltransferase involved in cell wall biosynthesis
LAREDYALVLLGGAGRAERSVREAIRLHGQEGRIVRTGRVSDADRDAIVTLADALLFPSEYEGFGAPVLEAMALGTPVVISDRAALPEIGGDAAAIAPLDLESWAAAIDRVTAERTDFLRRGRVRAAQFSIEASGNALVAAYRAAVC